MDEADIRHLSRALELAEKGRGRTSPNPMVGAVIAREGRVLGEGWHAGAGLDHAEVAAIRDALRRAGRTEAEAQRLDWDVVRRVCSDATIYVSLEPCCTQGRTPPCTVALIAGGFSRAVVGAVDPTPAVNGQGLRALREAGVRVELAEGELNRKARRQNDALRKIVTRGLPFVTYKYAMTLDGRVASDCGDSRWISSEESRTMVHRWRAWSDAVVVGAGTMATDDPTLTARGVECVRQPLRVVVDAACSMSGSARLVASAAESPVLVICGEQVSSERRAELQGWGVSTEIVGRTADQALDSAAVCETLVARGVQSVLLEGGPSLAGSWWELGLIDRVAAFVCPKIASGEKAKGPLFGRGVSQMRDALGLEQVEMTQVGPDMLISGYTGGPF